MRSRFQWLLLLTVLFSGFVEAKEESPKVGTVDMYSLLLLHPQMRHFSFEAMRFETWTAEDLKKPVKEVQKQRADFLQNLARELQKWEVRYSRERDDISQKSLALGDLKRQQALIKEWEDGIFAARQIILAQSDRYLLSRAQTYQTFAHIWQSIKKSIRKVKADLALKAVFVNPSESKADSPRVKEYALDGGRAAEMINEFYYFLNYRAMGKTGADYELQLRDYFARASSLNELVRPWYSSRQILYGSRDITKEVLEALYASEGQPKKYTEIVGDAWNFWKSREVVAESRVNFYPLDFIPPKHD